MQLRSAFDPEERHPLPESERDLVIYCSRRDAHDRLVENEDVMLAAIAEQLEASATVSLYVFKGSETVLETVSLFRRAKAVVGMHGAGLSHAAFSAPGTAVIEFLFTSDPPLMFW